MELPQPRPYGTQGKPTHDFLSLYSQVQDPNPPQEGYPKTHDFLQPLERVGKPNGKQESVSEKTTPSGEHVLPGGIGTYSISHISHYNQRLIPKPEGISVSSAVVTDHSNENSNSSSEKGVGFTLWEESSVKKGKTGKENNHSGDVINRGGKIGGSQWGVLERPSQSSSNIVTSAPYHLTGTTSFSSRSSSQPPFQKNQSFMDMLKSAKTAHEEDDDDEDEYGLKKEVSPPPLKSELTVKVGNGGGKSTEQKPNTPRSKHSATEQRRRSKINDRFHMLRELIPNSDQKRDKASFLLEVIEYIQHLQDKVHKYEGPYQGWNQELPRLMPWNNKKHGEDYADPSQTQNSNHVPTVAFAAKFDENGINFSPTNPVHAPKATGSDMKTFPSLTAINRHFELPNKAPSTQTNASTISPIPLMAVSDMQNTISQPPSQLWPGIPCIPDFATASSKLKEQDLAIESGIISISSIYSQGLLNSLTQALQSSGVDLSQANISVQINLGNRAKNKESASASIVKDDDSRYTNQVMATSRGATSRGDPDQDRKRLKTR